jgi:hypothetical protein
MRLIQPGHRVELVVAHIQLMAGTHPRITPQQARSASRLELEDGRYDRSCATVASVVSVPAIELGGPDGYLYSESRSEYGCHHMSPDPKRVWVYTHLQHRQIWRGWDGSGLIRERTGPPRFFTTAGRTRWEALGSPELPSGLHQIVMAPGCMEGRRWQQHAARLPTDPVELRAAIAREPRGERLPAEEAFSAVRRLLRTPEAPVELCRALYRVACTLPGIVELGEVVDRAGRPGLGIEAEDGGCLHRLVFDRDTARLLGEQETLTNPELDYAPVGTVTGWAVYLREERVATLPRDAPGVPGPPCMPGQASVMREVRPGLKHATGRPNPDG